MFQFSSCWFLVLYHWGQKNTWYDFCLLEFAKTCRGLSYDLFWRMFHVYLRRMCILQLLDEIFCKCLLSPSGLMFSLNPLLLYCFLFCFVWMSIHCWKWSIKVPCYYFILYFSLKTVSICLMDLGLLILSSYIVIIVIYSWRNWLTLSLHNDLLCFLLTFLA